LSLIPRRGQGRSVATYVNGGLGSDTLTMNDSESTSGYFYDVKPTSVTRLVGPPVTVNYSSIESLRVTPGPLPPFTFPPLAKGLKFPSAIATGAPASLTGHLADASGDKKLTLTVDWSDGSSPTIIKPGQKPFRLKHKFAAAGTDTVRAIWSDSAGASNFRDLSLSVAAAKTRPAGRH
jgi:hypothetical protein